MRKRSGALIVASYEELLDEMKHRDQVASPSVPVHTSEDCLSTQADEDDEDTVQSVITLKVLVLGSQGVGKSALINRFVTKEFTEHCEATNGMELRIARVNMQGREVKLEMWEAGGVSLHQACLSTYYKSVRSAIVVFDPLASDSCAYVQTVRSLLPSEKPVIAVARRTDCALPEDLERFAVGRNVLVLAADAKTGVGVEAVFDEAGRVGLT